MSNRSLVALTDPQLLALHRLAQSLLHHDHPTVRRAVNDALDESSRVEALNAASQLQAAVAARALPIVAGPVGAGR